MLNYIQQGFWMKNKQAPISRVVEGIYWAIDKKVNIISISFGTNQYSEALKQAIDEANAKGILVIAAAGNQGENGTDNVEYPAAFEKCCSSRFRRF